MTPPRAEPKTQPAGDTDPNPSAAASSRPARERWRAVRVPLVIAVVIVLAGVLLAVLGRSPSGRLDPRAVDPTGSRALAQLLTDRGIGVERTTSAAQLTAGRAGSPGHPRTLLVADPASLSADALRRLGRSGSGVRVVLLGPTPRALSDVGGDVQQVGRITAGLRPPGCALPAARIAGRVELTGDTYRSRSSGGSCYGGGLVTGRTARGAELVVLDNGDPFTNQNLNKGGNAALAVGLLGDVDSAGVTRASAVTWLPVARGSDASGSDSLAGLLPGWVVPAVLGLALAAFVASLWRGAGSVRSSPSHCR